MKFSITGSFFFFLLLYCTSLSSRSRTIEQVIERDVTLIIIDADGEYLARRCVK